MNKLIELKDAVKSKVLFRTEDGVDIFEGDKYYSVWKEDLTFQGTFRAEKINLGKFTNPKTMVVFSTKEAAEEYIIMNKPCLSIKDLETINRNNLGSILISRYDLKKIVKKGL